MSDTSTVAITGAPSPIAARRVLLTLTWTRWFPVGFVIPTMTLFQLQRGLSLAQALTATAVAGVVTVMLELPTSAVADATGRRRVYLVAAVVNVLAGVVFTLATSFWGFVAAAALMGVFRALDSGPLEAWYVDSVHAHDPGADVDGALSAQGTALGVAIALGALTSGVLVWWHPMADRTALLLPVLVFAALNVVHLVAAAILLTRPRPDAAPPRGYPTREAVRRSWRTVGDSLRLLRVDQILLALLAAEICWSIAMIVFEQLMPVRLAELTGSQERAGVLAGPLTSTGWVAFAAGSALAGLLARRIGVARTAVLARALNGIGAACMGLAAGPGLLALTYLLTYALHGSNGPMHATLLHRRARSDNRATVLSMNSLFAFAAFAVAAPVLGLVATGISTPVAMVVGGAVGILGAVFYLPARRAELTAAQC